MNSVFGSVLFFLDCQSVCRCSPGLQGFLMEEILKSRHQCDANIYHFPAVGVREDRKRDQVQYCAASALGSMKMTKYGWALLMVYSKRSNFKRKILDPIVFYLLAQFSKVNRRCQSYPHIHNADSCSQDFRISIVQYDPVALQLSI